MILCRTGAQQKYRFSSGVTPEFLSCRQTTLGGRNIEKQHAAPIKIMRLNFASTLKITVFYKF
jgi:hypothetical protein